MKLSKDKSTPGEIQVDWFMPNSTSIGADRKRQRLWVRHFKKWAEEFAHESARVATLPPTHPTRDADEKALTALQLSVHARRDHVNKLFDSREKVKIDADPTPKPKPWLDARHFHLWVSNIFGDHLNVRLAALSCGYGLAKSLSPAALRNPSLLWDDEHFVKSLALDIDSALSHVDFDTGVVRQSYGFFESTKKGTISFTLGGIFCYLIAEEWMGIQNTQMVGMYNYLQYGEAMVASHKDFYLPSNHEFPAEGSTPDYLVLDSMERLHAFEAKGCAPGSRFGKLREGLLQLRSSSQSVTMMRRNGSTDRPVAAGLAVCTTIEAGKKLRVFAYDPPGDDYADFVPELPSEPDPSPPPDYPGWKLMPDVAFCLDAIEKYQLFLAYAGDEFEEFNYRWKRVGSLRIGVNATIPYERLGASLLAYRKVRAYLPRGLVSTVVEDGRIRSIGWKERLLDRASLSADRLGNDTRQLLEAAVHESENPSEVVRKFALDQLNLDTYAKFISDTTALVVPDLARANPIYRFKAGPSGLVVAALK